MYTVRQATHSFNCLLHAHDLHATYLSILQSRAVLHRFGRCFTQALRSAQEIVSLHTLKALYIFVFMSLVIARRL